MHGPGRRVLLAALCVVAVAAALQALHGTGPRTAWLVARPPGVGGELPCEAHSVEGEQVVAVEGDLAVLRHDPTPVERAVSWVRFRVRRRATASTDECFLATGRSRREDGRVLFEFVSRPDLDPALEPIDRECQRLIAEAAEMVRRARARCDETDCTPPPPPAPWPGYPYAGRPPGLSPAEDAAIDAALALAAEYHRRAAAAAALRESAPPPPWDPRPVARREPPDVSCVQPPEPGAGVGGISGGTGVATPGD